MIKDFDMHRSSDTISNLFHHSSHLVACPISRPLMAGGALKYRHLNRSSAHRQALLRNLVTSLIAHESIRTTWHKAKEAQRLAEKLITLGKKNTEASRRRAEQILFVCGPGFLVELPISNLRIYRRNLSNTCQLSSRHSVIAT